MEDVLEVYQRPLDPRRPLVCMDELLVQLIGDRRAPLAVRPGDSAKQDYEYEHQGTCNLFMAFEPLCAQRWVTMTQRRTKHDWALWVKDLVDGQHSDAEVIVLVCDNLNTHTPAALYETFTPAEARRLTEKLEIHYTPKHGSWLNMAEIELSVLVRQCLHRRLPSATLVEQEITVWQRRRNTAQARIEWRFTTADARIKLKRLYPAIHL
jgi:transposase